MKKTLLSIAALFALLGAQAQILFDKSDLIKRDTNYTKFKVLDTSWVFEDIVDLGKPGANGVYDFTKMDSLGYDSTIQRYAAPGTLGSAFSTAHPSANMATTLLSNVQGYREPIKFGTNDFTKKDEVYTYQSVATTGTIGDLRHYIDYGRPGKGGNYYFESVDDFVRTDEPLTILDPAKTAWSGTFTSASSAKLADVTLDANDKVLFEEYHFYETQGNDYVRTGIGVKIDKGALATGTPNGTYTNVNATVRPAHLVRSTDFVPDTVLVDSSVWYAQASEGFNTLNRWNFSKDSILVNGAGTVYLPRDSFEATQVWRKTMNVTVDSITIFGNLQPITIDTQYMSYVEYYAKGFGEPIVKITLDKDSNLVALHYLDTTNAAGFTPLKTDTIVKLMAFSKGSNTDVSRVGLSYIVDLAAATGNGGPSGTLDTLHGSFTGTQLESSASFAYGFTNKDSVSWEITLDMGNNIQLKIEQSEVVTMGIDGYGIIHLREDTAEALRLKIKKVEYQTQTTLFNGVPVDTDTDESEYYYMQFLGKKAGIPLVDIEFYDEDYDGIESMSFTHVAEKLITSTPQASKNSFALYPNPASERFTVTTAHNENQRIEVLDLTGKIVLSQNIQGNSTIDASQMDAGVYLVKMTQVENGTVSTVKLIVE